MKNILSLLFLLVFIAGCKKENLDDCFSNAGDVVAETRQLSYFENISLYDNVNLVLVDGNGFSVKVEGGENLISSVQTEVIDSTLVIHNSMKCNWVRDYKNELTVYVSSASLKSIRYESSGDLKTIGNLKFDELSISVWGGSGSFDLDLDCNRLDLGQHYGTVDFNVSGKSLLTAIYSNSYGPFNCYGLSSNIVYIKSNGTNDCFINANHILEAEITSVGNIYYTGNPYEIKSQVSGSGKLIKIE
jgi:hypothetical protein